ncbi:hypothetical protein OP10G_4350 [Fimbriimonas ginsengisoli Gsoil 348]|uniref:Uncharacterized protein n=1 Tax=Fimbriimonas ginsengisoli Gsoil 348 TaxID=661478 RepID=A0A068NW15_FIMGI|nr:hypothetical protein OP10G_4350 [Fimbriimonas ginsengisoli Gsoil 348]
MQRVAAVGEQALPDSGSTDNPDIYSYARPHPDQYIEQVGGETLHNLIAP